MGNNSSDLATHHIKNFNHISVQKYISFFITNFITSILYNAWEMNNLSNAISVIN